MHYTLGMTTDHEATSDAQTFQIIGAAMDVHRELGCGFLEQVYREPFGIELTSRRVPFATEVSCPIVYKGRALAVSYRVDFICFGEVVVELKALSAIGPNEVSQAINYLRAAKLSRALVLNFGARSLQYRRVVWGYGDQRRRPSHP
jgi:GxxExxY protein